jgi:Ankyrin repeats (3 copies)/Ankyrin repeat
MAILFTDKVNIKIPRMALKSADKLKLAAAGTLLVVLALGALIVWMYLPTDSASDVSAPPVPATQPSTPKSDFGHFLRIVQSDDIQQATAMLAKDPSLAKQSRARDGATPLHLAISVSMAKLLLDNGADINAHKSAYSGTPLRWAASQLLDRKPESRELVRFLQSRGAAEPDIYFAAAVGDIPQMKKLLAADPSLLEKSSRSGDVLFDSCSPLQIAAYADAFDSAKFLIDQGANVRNRSGWHNTEALEKAAWAGGADVVALLLDHGASVDGSDKVYGDIPLQNAATMGHADVVKILLAHGATIPRRLIPDVRAAMQHPDNNSGPTSGTQDEFKQVLEMLSAITATQPAIR